jgi:uncharacterized membrane protein (DUF2068 family)
MSRKIAAGVRTVAVFEASKGALVLVAGCGLLRFLHRDVRSVAEELVEHLHLNPAKRAPHVFLDAVDRLPDVRLSVLALFAFAYAVMRFVEAYGLWRVRRWAEWVAVASGAIYLPFEVYELARGVTWLRLATFAINLAIVAMMAYAIRAERADLGRAVKR